MLHYNFFFIYKVCFEREKIMIYTYKCEKGFYLLGQSVGGWENGKINSLLLKIKCTVDHLNSFDAHHIHHRRQSSSMVVVVVHFLIFHVTLSDWQWCGWQVGLAQEGDPHKLFFKKFSKIFLKILIIMKNLLSLPTCHRQATSLLKHSSSQAQVPSVRSCAVFSQMAIIYHKP